MATEPGTPGAAPGEPPGGPERVSDVGEFDLIGRVTAGRELPPGTLLGPGDDAAVIAAPDGRVVISTDVLVESVHFRLDWSTPEQVGRKAVAANLADIAAMGAVPTTLVCGLACPPHTSAALVEELAAGLWAEAGRVGVGISGGDMVAAEQLVISITALGDLQGRDPVMRSGARPGDVLALCGRLGWSAAGYAVLRRGFRSPVAVVDAHRVPDPPYRSGAEAAIAGATAMIDVSDGLVSDAGHVAAASGVCLDIRTADVPLHQRLVDVGKALGADPLQWLLTGGEDHALLATFPPDAVLPAGWTPIGAVVGGAGVLVDGAAYQGDSGWSHFRT